MATDTKLGFDSDTIERQPLPLDPPVLKAGGQSTSLDALFEGAPVLSFDPEQTVFWEGDPAEHVFKVCQGLLRIGRLLPDGRRAINGFAFAGDYLGLSFKDSYLFSAEAITPVKLVKVTRECLDEFQAAPLGSQLVFDQVRDELCAMQDQILLLQQNADARIARFLCQVARRLGGDLRVGMVFNVAMPRCDIADHLGLAMETVCRSITKLRKSGCIAKHGHQISLRQPLRLMQLAKVVDVLGGRA
jgi:CRP/FNR family transcriptional regulator, anaerobic regulatory protein